MTEKQYGGATGRNVGKAAASKVSINQKIINAEKSKISEEVEGIMEKQELENYRKAG